MIAIFVLGAYQMIQQQFAPNWPLKIPIPSWAWFLIALAVFLALLEGAYQRICAIRNTESNKPILIPEITIKDQEDHNALVKRNLESLSMRFPEVLVDGRHYYSDYPAVDEIMLKQHFRDDGFWEMVRLFEETDKIANSIYKELCGEILKRAELEVAPLNPYLAGNISVPCITLWFLNSVISSSVNSCLGIVDDFHRYEWRDDVNGQIWAGNFISFHIKSELQHREYVTTYTKDGRCNGLADIIGKLKASRVTILTQIEYCLVHNLYKDHNCFLCPVMRRASHKAGSQS